jgi:cbb3-type cytochrome c oxidase subunit III
MKSLPVRVVLIVFVGLFVFMCRGVREGSVWAIAGGGGAQGAGAGAAVFKSKCATCHGKDGRGKTFKAKFNGARNLTDAAWQERVTDERIFNSITNGRGSKMPAFGDKLSVAEIEALVAHVRGLKK